MRFESVDNWEETDQEFNGDLPGFGPPQYPQLLAEAKKISSRLSGPEYREGAASVSTILSENVMARTYAPIEFQQQSKGEDRIFFGSIDKYPIGIIADGASSRLAVGGGSTISGEGGTTAQEAVLGVLEKLNEQLKPGLDSIEVSKTLEAAFAKASQKIAAKQIKGATTLLVSLLYDHQAKDGSKVPFWHYAYVGDSRIRLLSPERNLDGFSIETRLMTEQKFDTTATVNGTDTSVAPVIGSVQWTRGDLMIMASDGVDGMDNELWEKERINLSYAAQEQGPVDGKFPQRLAKRLSKLYRLLDDGCIGVIATGR